MKKIIIISIVIAAATLAYGKLQVEAVDENGSKSTNENYKSVDDIVIFDTPVFSLPFQEDFTGIATGQIPEHWMRTHSNWGASPSNQAGGNAPEMKFSFSPLDLNVFRLITPLLDATTINHVGLFFKQRVSNYTGDYLLKVQTSPDGIAWTDQWVQVFKKSGPDMWSDSSQPLADSILFIPDISTYEVQDRLMKEHGVSERADLKINLQGVGGTQFYLAFVFEGFSYNINFWNIDDIVISEVQLQDITADIKVILEGAFTGGDDILMNTALNPYIPLNQPFGPQLPWFGNDNPVWYYTGNESVTDIPDDVVDWVLLELRDAPDASQADGNTVIARQAAFLYSSGHIKNTLGELPVFYVEPEHDLFIVVYHRNHIAVMSSEPLIAQENIYSWDFTQADDKAYNNHKKSAFQNGHKHLGNGLYGMFGGDGDGNGQIQTQDKNEVWNQQAGQSGYLPGDFDMNGQVQTQDKNNIWNPNSGVATQVP